MRAELANLNHCTVPFLSRAAVNLCWYYYTTFEGQLPLVYRYISQRTKIYLNAGFCKLLAMYFTERVSFEDDTCLLIV